MKITKLLGFFLLGALLTACGDSDSEKESSGFEIKAEEFSGTFNISDGDVERDMPYSSNGNDGWVIDFKDKTSLYVNVEEEGFETHLNKLMDSKSFTVYELIEQGDNWAVTKGTRDRIGEEGEDVGYNFLLVTDGPDGKFLLFQCSGEDMFSDAPTEERARELLKVAQSFKMK